MSNATTVRVTFPITLSRGDYAPGAYQSSRDYTVTKELRAEVTFRGVNDEPEVTRLEKAEWEELTHEEGVQGEELAIEAAREVAL